MLNAFTDNARVAVCVMIVVLVGRLVVMDELRQLREVSWCAGGSRLVDDDY